MISDNLKSVRQRIARCCEKTGRSPQDVTLVCVTKEASTDEAAEVLRSGIRDLGENRVQELVSKYRVIGDAASWHLVGHLQTNKVRDAVRISCLIHSLDSAKLAREIDKEAEKLGKVQDALVQVNVSGETAKYGVSPDELSGLLKKLSLYRNINIMGLMTIAPESGNVEDARPHFRKLRELSAVYGLRMLSMGMTNDFEVAIEEGSTMVRVGRAIFGE